MSSARDCPLAGESFYLDIPRGKNLEFLTENVKRLGGVVESFLSKEVTCVVSSSQEAKQEKRAEKPTRAARRETRTETQPSADLQKDCGDPLHKTLDPALISRGKKLLHKAIGNQDNIGGNSILVSARSWGVQIIHIDEMVAYIQRLSKKRPSKVKLGAFGFQPPKVLRLKAHFLKIEDVSRQLCPFFKQFRNFPQLYFLARKRHSPFVPPQSSSVSKEPNSRGSLSGSSPPAAGCLVPKTRKGYCECCKGTFAELHAHLQSPHHMAHVMEPSHYAPIDRLISQLTNDFVAFSSTPPSRMSPGISNGVPSGFQTEAVESMSARPPTLNEGLQCCRSAEGPVGHHDSRGGSPHLLEDQGIAQLAEQQLEMLSIPVSPVLLPPGLACEAHERDRMFAETAPEATALAEVKHDALPQETGLQTEPAVLSRKRRLSCSPYRQAKKRQAPASDERQRGAVLLPEEQQVDATEYVFGEPSQSQTAPRHLDPSAGLPYTSSLFAVPSQLSQEGLPSLLCKPVAIDTEYLKSPVQQLDQEEVSALHPNKEWDMCQHCNFSRPHVGLGSSSGFPMDKRMAPKLLGSVVHSSSLRVPEVTPAVLSEPQNRGPGSCLLLPSNSQTHLCTEEKSSSSILEWDGPLLCVLAGASHLPSEGVVDAALLGTCISLQDSNYESHLCSVLQQTPDQRWACKDDLSHDQKSHMEMERAPFTPVQACLEN
nr:protein DBF4 homolog B isoform X2 [Pogona vitticeps]